MIISASPSGIRQAAELLRHGKIVAFPTETVYGLGGDARSVSAIQKIFEVKRRPATNPLIVHLPSVDLICTVANLDSLTLEQKKHFEALSRFWPGALSVVLPKRPDIPDLVTAGLPSVAVRIPSHPVALAVLKEAGIPIAAPSANPFTYISPTTALHVEAQIGDLIPLILDGGPCQIGLESTVVSLVHEKPALLRPGAVTREMLKEVVPDLIVLQNSSDSASAQHAPGQHKKHYAPKTPVYSISDPAVVSLGEKTGYIGFNPDPAERTGFNFARSIILSEKGNLEEAARHFFRVLRELDQSDLDAIVIGKCSPDGIGEALTDRINRALTERE